MRVRSTAIIAIAIVLGLVHGGSASAVWSGRTAPGAAVRARATFLLAGNQPVAAVTPPTAATVNLTWTATGGDVPLTGYQVRAFDATSGTPRAVAGTCTGVVAALSCADATAPEGRWRYTVAPRRQAWAGAQSTPSAPVTVDLTAPTITQTFPVNGALYSATSWNAGCSGGGFCGTAGDTIGLASVAISVRQGAGNYWNGTSFASATEVLVPVTGTTSWTRSFPAATFPADGAYTTRAVATDTVGRTTATSATFTIDRTAPQPTALTLQNANGFLAAGDAVNITYSEALRPSSICSAWAGTGDQTMTNATIVVINDGLRDIPTISSPTCTLNIGATTSATDYVLLNTTFGNSSVTWTAATRTLRIVTGPFVSGLTNVLPQAAHTSNYTPAAAITDLAGNPIVTTLFTSANQRF